jgi:hypothetical protein
MFKLNAEILARQSKGLMALCTAFGAVAGAAASVTVAMKRAEKIYREQAEKEIAEAREYFAKLGKTGEFSTPESAYEALHGEPAPTTQEQEDAVTALTRYGATDGSIQDVLEFYRSLPDHEQELLKNKLDPTVVDGEIVEREDAGLTEVTRNVFTDAQIGVEDFDPDAEQRGPEAPYVIRFEEFLETKPGYTAEQLTYYEGDGTLCKDDDELVDDVNGLVGDQNLLKFGLGSQDVNVVYIRNERYNCDFEVTRVKGTYDQVVHGIIEHSDNYHRKTPRFRGDDE